MKSSSEVLARKYRPRNFEELIGQESISQTLALALDNDRLSHAYLFSGLRGSGKTSTARIFSKALICDKGPTSNPCEVCEPCQLANENRHMDIIEMDAASSRRIDDIRDLIEHTKYKPASARFKIFIIDEVHMLTKEAFNALLKTLEEPPPYVKFILATTDPLKLPPTILSRTQHFRFKKISTQNITHHLQHILNKEEIAYENEALEILARSGSGSLRDTLTLLDQAIIYSKNYVDVKTVTEMLGLVDPQFIENIFAAIFAKEHHALTEHIKALEEYESELVVDEIIAFLKDKLYTHDHRFSPLLIERFFRILSEAKSLFYLNADSSFVLSLVFFKMLEALKIKDIDDVIESLEHEVELPQMQQVVQTEESDAPPAPIKEQNSAKTLFQTLCTKISDRNAELGECFEKNITFVSFEEGVLSWESCADEACKKQLGYGYSVIKQFVKEIFGFETKIKGLPCSKSEEEREAQSAPDPEPAAPQPFEHSPQPELPDGNQTPSTTQDIETGDGSCVTACDDSQKSKELDGKAILEEPMIKKMQELFEPTKITIRAKI